MEAARRSVLFSDVLMHKQPLEIEMDRPTLSSLWC